VPLISFRDNPDPDEKRKEILWTAISFVVILAVWLAAYGLHLSRWHAPRHTGDVAVPVLLIHALLPVAAGALVAWWRGAAPGRIAAGMGAGAVVLTAAALMVVAPGSAVLEIAGLLIALGVVGALLGLLGAAGSAAVRRAQGDDEPPPAPAGPHAASRRPLLIAAWLLFAAAALVVLAVIPPVLADTFPRAAPERAAGAFRVNVVLNALLGAALLVAAWRRSGAVLPVSAGLLSLLLGAALLDAASAFTAHGPALRGAVIACFASSACDLAAGATALAAARRPRREAA